MSTCGYEECLPLGPGGSASGCTFPDRHPLGRHPFQAEPPPRMVTNAANGTRYAPYWNTFLSLNVFTSEFSENKNALQ